MVTHTKQEILDILKYHPYLVSFLQKKKIFFKFVNYSMNPKWNAGYDYIVNAKHARNIFGQCFHFSKTKEGQNYWNKLWEEYSKYLRNNSEI